MPKTEAAAPAAPPAHLDTGGLDLARARDVLEADFARLARQVAGQLGEPGPEHVRGGHAGDAAAVFRAWHETDAALYRIDCGTYGICDSCDRPIEPARLVAHPRATLAGGAHPRHSTGGRAPVGSRGRSLAQSCSRRPGLRRAPPVAPHS